MLRRSSALFLAALWLSLLSREAPAAPAPGVLVDQRVRVSPRKPEMRRFHLDAFHDVRLEVTGLKHAEKGFTVYVMPASEWSRFRLGNTFSHLPAFHGPAVREYVRTAPLPPGDWAVVIANSENPSTGIVTSVKLALAE